VLAGSRDLGSVLSLWKLSAGDEPERYYLEQVAQGREDYYAGEGEAPGQWAGSGGAVLGLGGRVEDEGLARLLQARDPSSGEELRRPMREGAVAGFDLTFRAPKSVSILWGAGDAEVARDVRAAHDVAVERALGYLEDAACLARRGRGGHEHVRGEGFVAAAFRHRSSRAGDPLLHTHVVVGNLTRGPDGRWTALDGRLLYRHAKTAGVLYQAELRAELVRRLGVEFGPVEQGCADLVGVPREVIEHFSQRRGEIIEHMDAHGGRSARAAQIAALETRRAKQTVPNHRLRDEWCARAAEQGLGRAELAALTGPPREPGHVIGRDHVAALLHELTEEASTFDRRDVMQAWAQAHRDGITVCEAEAFADEVLATSAVVRVDRAGGPAGEPRYTTPELLAVERELLTTAAGRRNDAVSIADPADVAAAIAERPTLSEDQAQLVRRLTGSGDGVEVVRAPAGTGKTFALEAARCAWEASGNRVFGCALSARAACELQDQAGIDATTIACLAGELDRGHSLQRGDVLIVDEAGMVGTRSIARLAAHTAEVEAKLVLVGDDRQLPELQAGGAFRSLADRLGAGELREVRRQRHDWDRDALTALRDGDIERWAHAYREHGRIVARPTSDGVRRRLVSDWWRANRDSGCDAVMIAHRRDDVGELNQRARALMRATGQLGPDELDTGERSFAVGERVVCERNDRTLGVVNGQRGEVAAVDPERRAVQLRLTDGASIELDAGYLEAGHLSHGYALTAHKAQGATVDRAFVLGSDDLYREWGYTALSRHRDEARFYLVSPGSAERALAASADERDPLIDRLEDLFGTSRAKALATDELDVAERRAELEQLAADHQRLLTEERRAEREREGAEQARDAAEHQLERLREERAAVGLFDRGERRRIAAMSDAAAYNRDHYDQLAGERAETLGHAVEERRAWLEANAEHAGTLLAAEREATADEHLALRDELADRVRSSDPLLDRDAHALGMTTRGPELVPEPPAVDMDLDLDFGP
jgi:conjugative relaxase-like TrwC/TraI family protein